MARSIALPASVLILATVMTACGGGGGKDPVQSGQADKGAPGPALTGHEQDVVATFTPTLPLSAAALPPLNAPQPSLDPFTVPAIEPTPNTVVARSGYATSVAGTFTITVNPDDLSVEGL